MMRRRQKLSSSAPCEGGAERRLGSMGREGGGETRMKFKGGRGRRGGRGGGEGFPAQTASHSPIRGGIENIWADHHIGPHERIFRASIRDVSIREEQVSVRFTNALTVKQHSDIVYYYS